jgi:ankyrin repeat protein
MLVLATQDESLAAVQLLLERGADVNARDSIGETALIAAIFAKNPGIALYLVNHGADVNANSMSGLTAGWGVAWALGWVPPDLPPGPVRTQFEQLRSPIPNPPGGNIQSQGPMRAQFEQLRDPLRPTASAIS